MKYYTKEIVFILSIFTLVLLYLLKLPYNNLPEEFNLFLALFRIFYFLIFIIFLIKLKELNIIQYGKKFKEFNLIINIKIVISILIIIGIYTQFFLVINFLLYLYLFRKNHAKFYGIEQSYHQIVGIFFVISGSNNLISLDNFLGITSLYIFDQSSAVNFLILSLSICLISGFYEKINSPIWKRGNALKIFLNLPQVRTVKYNKTLLNLLSLKSICYLALLNQTLIFFLYFDSLRILFYVGELIFSILLITIAPFHFIGETFILVFLFLIGTEISLLIGANNKLLNFIDFNNLVFSDFVLLFLLINSLISVFFKLPKFLQFINRYTLGLYPFKVYTETHIFGIRVFKINGCHNEKIIFDNIFEVYNEEGFVGRKQKWMPRTIHALTYKLTDICEKKLTNSTDANDDQIILNLFKNVKELNKDYSQNINNLRLFIKTINPDENLVVPEKWIDQKWTEIAKYDFNNNNTFEWTGIPTKSKKFLRNKT